MSRMIVSERVDLDPVGAGGRRRLARPTAEIGALVIGGDYRGLGVVRSLGRRGVRVWVLTDDHRIAGTSRFAERSLPWPAGNCRQQLGFLLDLVSRHRLDGWVIIPTGDEAVAFLARHHAVLSDRLVLTTPPWEEVRWAYDKRLTTALASELGLDQPWTCSPRDRVEVAALECPFPAIVKPAYKVTMNRFTYVKAWQAEDAASLLARYDEACTFVDPDSILVQELIPGGGETQFSYAALCQDGHPLVWVVARRTRQYPVDFGRSSSYVETVEQPELNEPAQRLLAATRYTGLVEIEYKRDPRDGRYKLLEANPRVWGWHTLGRRAGVDFAYLLWRLVCGESVPEVRARAGARWVRLVTDLPAALEEIRRGRLSPGAYLRSLMVPLEPAIMAADDPLPGLLEVPLLCRLAWERRRW